ncbi:MAG TPA: PmoA family protein [Planctomycetota bacterium]|nr:PmoA family protein [Planctomycetota bacterium]
MKNKLTTLAVLYAFAAGFSYAGDAAVKLTKEEGKISVELNGKPFTTYYVSEAFGAPYVRPFFYPVLAADGTPVTDDQIQTRGDHPHHRSLWVAHGEVNDADHWSLKGDKMPKQRHVAFTKVEGDTIEQQLEWEGKDGQPMLKETRTWRFSAYSDGTPAIDLTSVYDPVVDKVTFRDTKEAGLISVRVVKPLAMTALVTNAAGGKGEKECWGKPAAWCDISGKVKGNVYGIAMFDHPSNPRHPSTWHVREYGLMGANIFGLSYFDKKNAKGAGDFTIEKGKPVTFKYRVVIHQGDATAAGLDAKYKEWAK